MTPAILVAFGALMVVASLVGALLAPSDYSPRQTFLRSEWPTHPHRLSHDWAAAAFGSLFDATGPVIDWTVAVPHA